MPILTMSALEGEADMDQPAAYQNRFMGTRPRVGVVGIY